MATRAGKRDQWPAASQEARAWKQAARAGTKADRTFSEVMVTLPPFIADREVPLTAGEAAEQEGAVRDIAGLDHSSGGVLGALGVLLLRSESVASSKIELIGASIDDYARAVRGVRANASAVAMVAASDALSTLIGRVSSSRRIALSDLTHAHARLMADDPLERAQGGRLRKMQNWVGGSDYSPRDALFVPPPPDTVESYMADLVAFVNRDDLPALTQAAIAHAQFETIHPFTDGNGRIGRALINAILRRRRVTTNVVVPLATALVAHRDRYFDLLSDYRGGQLGSLLSGFAVGARAAALESQVSARRLGEIPVEWAEMVGRIRRDSAVSRLLPLLLSHPILTTDDAVGLLDAAPSRVYVAIERLHDAGVLRPLTERKRNQIWGAGLVLDELDELEARVARASR